MQNIDHIEKLIQFLAVAELGTIRAASKSLGIAQPAISRSIKILEEEFKTELIIRSKKGVVCTEAGITVSTFAKQLISNYSELKIQVVGANESISGRLRIGTFESLTIYLWPKIINCLNENFPTLNVDLLTNNGPVLRSQMVEGLIDMTVDVEPAPQDGISTIQLYEDQYQFFVSTNSYLPKKRSYNLKDLENLPIIYVPKAMSVGREPLKTQLLRLGINKSRRTFEFDTFEAVKAMTANNLGMGLLPAKVAESHLKTKKIRKIDVSDLKLLEARHRVCASMKTQHMGSPKFEAALDIIRAECLKI